MDDAQLAAYMNITPEHAELFRAKDPAGWERYRSVCSVFQDVELWDQGLGPLPTGVMVDTPKTIRMGHR